MTIYGKSILENVSRGNMLKEMQEYIKAFSFPPIPRIAMNRGTFESLKDQFDENGKSSTFMVPGIPIDINPMVPNGDYVEFYDTTIEKITGALNIPRTMLWVEYRCPFDFIDEFADWFEFKRRVHFEGERTADVILSMVGDAKKCQEYELPLSNYAMARIHERMFTNLLTGTV